MEVWQAQVEEIIRKKFPDDGTGELVKEATKLLETAVEPPSGDLGEVVAELMKNASEELRPLVGVYFGFHLGVAWERLNK